MHLCMAVRAEENALLRLSDQPVPGSRHAETETKLLVRLVLVVEVQCGQAAIVATSLALPAEHLDQLPLGPLSPLDDVLRSTGHEA